MTRMAMSSARAMPQLVHKAKAVRMAGQIPNLLLLLFLLFTSVLVALTAVASSAYEVMQRHEMSTGQRGGANAMILLEMGG
ncbi:hypothetical protein AXF42_Ash018277 [Apostasia shenzhenica]|uniref:Uncharacterized protein n=1 Tax=Apostasia shenzhenica TaxID=1088818 RepID=A0A2I0B2P0_9ASPA|nr:hypothetical protein AXF42_Ash018277 [Apostasia shenzhenica]